MSGADDLMDHPGHELEPTASDFADLFDDPGPRKIDPRNPISAGRYRLPNPDGTPHKGGWMRMSNLAGALSDQKALTDWEIRQTLLGIRAQPDRFDQLCAMRIENMDKAAIRSEMKKFAESAKEAAGAGAGARRGTARHDMVEDFHQGRDIRGTRRMHEQLALYRQMMLDAELHAIPGMQERITVVPELNAAGKFDTILEDRTSDIGGLLIGDLKTQRKFWSLLEVRAQLAGYSRGVALWVPERETYEDMPAVDQDRGIAMHMPSDPEPGEPWMRLIHVDLDKGWRTMLRATEIVKDRAEAKSARALRDAVIAEAYPPEGMPAREAAIRAQHTSPAGLVPLALPADTHVAQVERYAARFASVATDAEGAALVVQARADGAWGVELAACARRAKDRLDALKIYAR